VRGEETASGAAAASGLITPETLKGGQPAGFAPLMAGKEEKVYWKKK
jgi:hypothetical protein